MRILLTRRDLTLDGITVPAHVRYPEKYVRKVLRNKLGVDRLRVRVTWNAGYKDMAARISPEYDRQIEKLFPPSRYEWVIEHVDNGAACTRSCQFATRLLCECSCKGRNHRKGWGAG